MNIDKNTEHINEAKWVRKSKDGLYWFECSNCGEHISKDKWRHDYFSNLCPKCGFKMKHEYEI